MKNERMESYIPLLIRTRLCVAGVSIRSPHCVIYSVLDPRSELCLWILPWHGRQLKSKRISTERQEVNLF